VNVTGKKKKPVGEHEGARRVSTTDVNQLIHKGTRKRKRSWTGRKRKKKLEEEMSKAKAGERILVLTSHRLRKGGLAEGSQRDSITKASSQATHLIEKAIPHWGYPRNTKFETKPKKDEHFGRSEH